MAFTTQKLANHRVLVEGKDINGYEGRMVLDSAEWDHLAQERAASDATEEFDFEVESFYAPLTAAADRLVEAAQAVGAEDPLFSEVIREGTQGVDAVNTVRIHLSKDSVILKLIELGKTARLVWVADVLEILESAPETSQTLFKGNGEGITDLS
jgi:hypothetical protein